MYTYTHIYLHASSCPSSPEVAWRPRTGITSNCEPSDLVSQAADRAPDMAAEPSLQLHTPSRKATPFASKSRLIKS